MNKLYLSLITLLLICVACKRFDSDRLNHQLIQGRWQQVEIIYPDLDRKTFVSELPEGATYLNFAGDSCVEELVDLGVTRRYSFIIKDYELTMLEEGHAPNVLEVEKLTEDSLLLQIQYRVWKYVKIKGGVN